jgi:hypothetical protein
MVTSMVSALPARYRAALKKTRIRVGAEIEGLIVTAFGVDSIRGVYDSPG